MNAQFRSVNLVGNPTVIEQMPVAVNVQSQFPDLALLLTPQGQIVSLVLEAQRFLDGHPADAALCAYPLKLCQRLEQRNPTNIEVQHTGAVRDDLIREQWWPNQNNQKTVRPPILPERNVIHDDGFD